MEKPLEITFQNLDSSPALDAAIREKVARLERLFERIVSCHVIVEAGQRRRRKGNLYRVKIVLHVPGRDIVIGRAGPKNHAHEDVYVALRDAFGAAARQLEDHSRKARGAVKTHEVPLHGKVRAVFPDHGFIDTADGQEIYFHCNSVVEGDFADLEVGSEVRLVVAHGESAQGPQASTVKPIGKHHLIE